MPTPDLRTLFFAPVLLAGLLAALVAPATAVAQDACSGGRVRSEATAGRCCWPGQSWSSVLGRCEGPPVLCPPGHAAEGDACVPVGAPAPGALLTPVASPATVQIAPVAPIAPLPRYERHSRSLVWMQVFGVVMWGIVYGTTIGVTAGVGGDGEEIGLSAVPLAGPWLCMAMCDNPDPYIAGLGVSGALQALSLVMIVIGSAVQVEYEVRVADTTDLLDSLEIVPWLGSDGAGASAALRF